MIGLAGLTATILVGRVHGIKLVVSPLVTEMDRVPTIRVTGLAKGQTADLELTCKDADGRQWLSTATFAPDMTGVVDVDKCAPLRGSYGGINPYGLIQFMEAEGDSQETARFKTDWRNPIKFSLSLKVGNLASALTFTRGFVSEDVKVTEHLPNGLVGRLFSPKVRLHPLPILVLGGSEGGMDSSSEVAALLASHGYTSLALAYFGAANLPPSLKQIPLEYFKRAISWLSNRVLGNTGVAILGTSKGSEAALLIASLTPSVKGVVAYVPSGLVWPELSGGPSSSWTLNGVDVPAMEPRGSESAPPTPGLAFRPAIGFADRLENRQAVARATIAVENIQGPILLISGNDDGIWPSTQMSKWIIARLQEHGHRFQDQHYSYKDAGHLIGKCFVPVGSSRIAGGRIEAGGARGGNAAAQSDSWPKVLTYLSLLR